MSRLPQHAPLIPHLLRPCGVSAGTADGCPRWQQDESPTRLTSSGLGSHSSSRSLTGIRLVGVDRTGSECAKARFDASQGDNLTKPIRRQFDTQWFVHQDDVCIGTVPCGHSVSRPPVRRTRLKPHHQTNAGTNVSAETDGLRWDVDFCSFSASAELPTFTMTTQENSNQPVHQIGVGVNCKMFANSKKDGSIFDKVQIVRTYRDGKEFKSTPSYSIDELPLVAMYAMKMYEIGIDRRVERSKANAEKKNQGAVPNSDSVSNSQ